MHINLIAFFLIPATAVAVSLIPNSVAGPIQPKKTAAPIQGNSGLGAEATIAPLHPLQTASPQVPAPSAANSPPHVLPTILSPTSASFHAPSTASSQWPHLSTLSSTGVSHQMPSSPRSSLASLTMPSSKTSSSVSSSHSGQPSLSASKKSHHSSSSNASKNTKKMVSTKTSTQNRTNSSKKAVKTTWKHSWYKNSTSKPIIRNSTNSSTVRSSKISNLTQSYLLSSSARPTRTQNPSQSKTAARPMPNSVYSGIRRSRKPTRIDDVKPGNSWPSNLALNYILDIDLTWLNNSNYIPNATIGWVCINHFEKHLLFAPNNTRIASPGLQQLAETGNLTNITRELTQWQYKGDVGSVFYSPTYRQQSPSTTSMMVNVSFDYPMISCIARLEPSSDWFTGLVDVRLVTSTHMFMDAVQAELKAYDAGTLFADTKTGNLIPEHANITTVQDSRVQNQIGFVTFGIA